MQNPKFTFPRLACLTGAALVAAGALSLMYAQTPPADVAGRWEFSYEAPATGRGGRGAGAVGGEGGSAPAAGARKATLDLKAGAGNTAVSSLTLPATGRGGAPGGNPLRPVEISGGKIEANHVSFSAWQFDGYKNRVRYEGTVVGDSLQLTLTRETPTGVETTKATATRGPR